VVEQSSTPEEAKEHKEKYMAWLSGLGDAALSPMNPMMKYTYNLS
jgi:hypothetical protein